MARLNWRLIASNIAEAREELEKIECAIANASDRSEEELKVGLEHAYHHLDFAWNARRASPAQEAHLTNRDFNAWGKLPRDLEMMRLSLRDKTPRQPNKPVQPTRPGRRAADRQR